MSQHRKEDDAAGLRVAVRVRPFNKREKQLRSANIVSMDGQVTTLINPREDDVPSRNFSFDHSFWSHDPSDSHFVSQSDVYKVVGEAVLSDAFAGYHSCVFAYGQTGAGKSYTMMGAGGVDDLDQRGLTPRLCEDLFQRIASKSLADAEDGWSSKVEVSYMEIYLETVRDLLSPNPNRKLKVREHKSTGPYVEDLSSHAVTCYKDVKQLMVHGDKLRTVKATTMNDVSSRSHAIFQIIFTQVKTTKRGNRSVSSEKVSKISLVDLAGSERSGQINTGRSQDRLKEGNQINRSLSALGKVMTSLIAQQSSKNKSMHHIPYRESVLTWLLRDSLGGNSKTFMMAAISPAATNYEETLSTLRYANHAKKIVNKAVVNEDPTSKIIRMLREEITSLKQQLDTLSSQPSGLRSVSDGGFQPINPSMSGESGNVRSLHDGSESHSQSIMSKLAMTEKLMVSLATPWEEKLTRTKALQDELQTVMEDHGLLLSEKENGEAVAVGVMPPKCTPYLVNLTHDPFSQHCLVYYLHEGTTTIVGKRNISARSHAASSNVIELDDEGIRPKHCVFRMCTESDGSRSVYISRDIESGDVMVNAVLLNDELKLRSGDQIAFGSLVFLFQTADSSPSGRGTSLASGIGLFGGDHSRRTTPSLRDSPAIPPPGSLAEQVFEAAALSLTATPQSSDLADGNINNGMDLLHIDTFIDEESDDNGEICLALPPVSRNRTSASYDFDPDHERAYLAHLVVNMASNQFSFKLMPAYGLFMMFRSQRKQGDEALRQLQSRVASLLEMATIASIKEHNERKLGLLLANTSELLSAMRTEESLVSTSGNAQVTITNCVESAFHALLADAKNKIRPALTAILYEDAALADAWISDIHQSGQIQTVDDLCDTLTSLHDLLEECSLGKSMIKSIFDSIFYFIGAAVFNIFISSKDRQMYRWDRGLLIRFNLATIKEWAEQRLFSVEHHLERIYHSAQLLQMNKSSLAHLDALCESCESLNSLQVAKILGNYRPAEGDKKLENTIIDCIKGRAMTKADVYDLEDESVQNTVRLLRDENHLLPFRLEGPFHVDEGLYDDVILEDAKTYLSLIDLASTSCKLPIVLQSQPKDPPKRSVTTEKDDGSFFSRWFSNGSKKKTRSASIS